MDPPSFSSSFIYPATIYFQYNSNEFHVINVKIWKEKHLPMSEYILNITE